MSENKTPLPRPSRPTAVGAYGDDADFLRARQARRLRPLDRTRDKDGKVVEVPVDVPAWFTREGLRTFTIDSGFGSVVVAKPGLKPSRRVENAEDAFQKALAHHEAVTAAEGVEKATIAAAEEALQIARQAKTQALVHLFVNAIVEIPSTWLVESPCEELSLTVGMAIPPPSTVYAATSDKQEAYLAMLPPSLPSQIFAGLGVLNDVAPIPYDEIRTNPS